MKRSQLKNKVNKTRDHKDFVKYKKQRNFKGKCEKQHFYNLNSLHDPKSF